MYKKRTTAGTLPLILGVFGTVMVFIAALLIMPYQTIRLEGRIVDLSFWSLFSVLVHPGIFLILLLTAIKTPRRGAAFGVVWVCIASLNLLFLLPSLYNLRNLHVGGIYETYLISIWIRILGIAAILSASIAFLIHLRKVPQPVPSLYYPVGPVPYGQPPNAPPFTPPYGPPPAFYGGQPSTPPYYSPPTAPYGQTPMQPPYGPPPVAYGPGEPVYQQPWLPPQPMPPAPPPGDSMNPYDSGAE